MSSRRRNTKNKAKNYKRENKTHKNSTSNKRKQARIVNRGDGIMGYSGGKICKENVNAIPPDHPPPFSKCELHKRKVSTLKSMAERYGIEFPTWWKKKNFVAALSQVRYVDDMSEDSPNETRSVNEKEEELDPSSV